VRFEARGRFAVSPEQIWPLVSDTQRLNRAMGLPEMRFVTRPLPAGGSQVIGAHTAGGALLALLRQLMPDDSRRFRDERAARWLPFPLVRWIEHPFEWEAPRRYSVLREYFWSPLGLFPFRSFRAAVELRPLAAGGTEVVASADVQPRNPPGALLTRFLLGPKNVRRVIRQCGAFEQYLLGRLSDPFPQLAHLWEPSDGRVTTKGREAVRRLAGALPHTLPRRLAPVLDGAVVGRGGPRRGGPARAPVGEPDAVAGWRALEQAGIEPDRIDQLRRHLLEAPDEQVIQMRPFELADRWGRDRRDTLGLFLHATTAGLLTMSWTVLCPNCRLPKATYDALPDLQAGAHCDYCNILFDAALDRQVEVRFSVASTIRQVEGQRFCSGGPMNAPHVVAQAALAPGEMRLLGVVVTRGAYRLRSPHSASTAILDVGASDELTTGPPSASASASGAGQPELAVTLSSRSVEPPQLAAPAGAVRLHMTNGMNAPTVLAVEELDWPDTAATAALVGTIQEFRDLFGSEALAPGLQLAVERLAFLFTDLTGSTALYQALGQARAFRLVQDHFRILRAAVVAHDGAVVKTIGDAVMATFSTSADAVAAALAMQRDMRRLEVSAAVDPARLLKIGIHAGPCLVVGANGRLDYFGTTINTAARVEHECRGGEVVMTAEVHDDPSVQSRLRQADLRAEPAEAQLRGVRAPVLLYRIADPVRLT
jgi:class 3 adenylate cyclase